jgi:DNA-directed RNA polymerase specialized sigma24 family protein
MAITIEKKGDGEPEEKPKKTRRKPGRPKGSKDSAPRRKVTYESHRKMERRLATLEKNQRALELENARLRDAADEANPVNFVPHPEHTQGEPLTEGELIHIANGGVKRKQVTDDMMAALARRAQVARLLLRGVAQTDISQHLGVPYTTVQSDMRAIRREWRESVNSYNISEAVGESLSFYREVRDLALREASNPLNKTTDIIGAVNAALKAEDSKNAFLARMGLYDVLDSEKRDAFRQGKSRELTQDSEEFNNVLSFMSAAATSEYTELEDIVEAAEFSDVEPFPDE